MLNALMLSNLSRVCNMYLYLDTFANLISKDYLFENEH